MRPVPIPDEEVWDGARRVVFSPPGGDLTDDTIRPVEALIDHPESMGGTRRICVRCVLEDDDLAKLAEGGHVWIGFWGQLVPFVIDVKGPGE